ncbi:aspartate-semialdehyde dehydrogenase [Candidatus Hydrogenosomobacter endosymbioticus]|uniref:Aspartate-semialdehyde dehydrogenase n=1 Tax=Candidatus Hydrogenosomobacter endosymbioticus TaxID=2558174 RepID=A0ABN6L2I6_9PROT|nr:aspartate-semialdehyde dehydrogenase [Candidatus Hydrogenosomobacter endosymbioticus]BDB95934.1 aspartate-semialdehyde dehydrogenase [Candidatus Hydrogenosomobacter endosymbioticus]
MCEIRSLCEDMRRACPDIMVVGATGNVGRCVVQILLEKNVPKEKIHLIASDLSHGRRITVLGKEFIVHGVGNTDLFCKSGIFMFATESDVSKSIIEKALSSGDSEGARQFFLDSSSEYRMRDDVMLALAPINGRLITLAQKIYSHANCIASPLSLVLNPLAQIGIKNVFLSTYQSVSGAGKEAMDELFENARAELDEKSYESKQFSRPIAFNVIPQIGSVGADGETGEENKIRTEVRKILANDIEINAASVRVPVAVGHSFSAWIKFSEKVSKSEIISLLSSAPFVNVTSSDGNSFLTPKEVVGTDEVHVGRIFSSSYKSVREKAGSVFHFWSSSDNLRRGAATDICETAITLIGAMTSPR